MTVAEAIAHFEARLRPVEATGIELHEVEDWIDSALQRLSEEVAEGPHAADFQLEQTATLDAAGVAPLPTNQLSGYISRVRHADYTDDFVFVNRGALQYQFGAIVFPLAAIENRKIYTKPPDDVGGIIAGELLVTGVCILPLSDAALTEPNGKFVGRFLDLLTEIGQERLKMNRLGKDPKQKETPVVAA